MIKSVLELEQQLAQLQELNGKLVEAYGEYVQLLIAEIEKHIGISIAHGYRGDEVAYKKGNELRARIDALLAHAKRLENGESR